MEGMPRFEVSQSLPDFPYARYAELIGLRGIVVDGPEQVAAAWDEALTADRPVVIDAIVDPNVPTLPPRPEAKVIEKLEAALAAEPEAELVQRQLAREGVVVSLDD